MKLTGKWTLMVKNIVTIIDDFNVLRGFFDTVTVRLENCIRGGKFPTLMGKLYYRQELEEDDIKALLNELDIVEKELGNLTVDDIVWNANDDDFSPEYSPKSTTEKGESLSTYFQNESGKTLIDIIRSSAEGALSIHATMRLKKF